MLHTRLHARTLAPPAAASPLPAPGRAAPHREHQGAEPPKVLRCHQARRHGRHIAPGCARYCPQHSSILPGAGGARHAGQQGGRVPQVQQGQGVGVGACSPATTIMCGQIMHCRLSDGPI
jgi:hypothetical protein